MKNNMLKYMLLLFLVILLAGNRTLVAQNYKELVEQAISASGNDALYLGEFKVKHTKVKKNKALQVSKSPIWLEKGKIYRINTANSSDYEGEVIVQLYDKKQLLSSTYNIKTRKDKGSFDFLCLRSDYYQLLMSFKEGKPGYAATVISLLVTDSADFNTLESNVDTSNMDVFYIGIDNPISISASNIEEHKLEISISNGKIIETNEGFFARVYEKGPVLLRVVSRDSTGKVRAIGNNSFYVKEIPLPYITITNKRSGIISKTDLLSTKGIELEYLIDKGQKYEIRNFKISKIKGDAQGLESIGDFFSPRQKQFIRSLKSGDKLVIYDIKLKAADGKKVEIESVEFVIE